MAMLLTTMKAANQPWLGLSSFRAVKLPIQATLQKIEFLSILILRDFWLFVAILHGVGHINEKLQNWQKNNEKMYFSWCPLYFTILKDWDHNPLRKYHQCDITLWIIISHTAQVVARKFCTPKVPSSIPWIV